LREVAAEGWALCNGEVLETHDSNPICPPPSIGGFFFVLLNFVPSVDFPIRFDFWRV